MLQQWTNSCILLCVDMALISRFEKIKLFILNLLNYHNIQKVYLDITTGIMLSFRWRMGYLNGNFRGFFVDIEERDWDSNPTFTNTGGQAT